MQLLKTVKFLIVLTLFFLKPLLSSGQESVEMHVHAGESFYVHASESVGIVSNVINSGSFGTYPGAAVNFSGQRWTNNAGSRLVDESASGSGGLGGYVRFISASGSAQFIDSRNTVPSANGFPNLAIANTGNVVLEGADLIIRGTLNFEAGKLILNNRNTVLASNATITGYDNTKFVVTGTGTDGGFLVRNVSGTQIADIVYPIGATLNSYTPASINYRGVAQGIKVRVFENVYERAVFGMPDNVNYVPKTWNVSFAISDPSAVMSLSTQHNANEEGSAFAAKRSESYISRYIASTEKWDKIASTGVSPANITTGNAIANAYLNSRAAISGFSTNEYFSKSILNTNTSPIAGLRIPAGISPNNDGLNEKFIIENLQPTDRVRLDIYNRWQTLVFRDGNYKNTFDGIGNQKGLVNNELPDGTYYYILNINTEKPITGYIVINR